MNRAITRLGPTYAIRPARRTRRSAKRDAGFLVKLRQFAADDLTQFAVDTRDPTLWDAQHGTPATALVRNGTCTHAAAGGSRHAAD